MNCWRVIKQAPSAERSVVRPGDGRSRLGEPSGVASARRAISERPEEGGCMDSSSKMGARAASGMWWLFLVTGILWLLISVIVLRFNITSVASVGVLLGVILLFAGVNEFLALGPRDVGWKWMHGLLGVLFIIGGIWAFVHPIGAFYELASILRVLPVFKGSFELIGLR